MSKILIVEDEEDFRELLAEVLRRAGYDVITAPNGEDGLAAYSRELPDLVLLDGNLPDLDGFEVCRRIRADGPRPETPILFCTVRSAVAPVAEGLRLGADDYIIKPFETKDLLARVKGVLAGRPEDQEAET